MKNSALKRDALKSISEKRLLPSRVSRRRPNTNREKNKMTMPEKYQLSPQDKKFEREELRFQRGVNSNIFLTWAQVFKKIKPQGTYQIYDGCTKKVGRGDQLLDEIHRRVLDSSYTTVMTITEVAQDFEQSTTDLWATYTDPKTGKTMVERRQGDVWNTDPLTANPDLAKHVRDFPMNDKMVRILDILADAVIQQRSIQGPFDEEDLLEKTREAVILAVKQSYSHSLAVGTTAQVAEQWALQPGGETFDRTYHRERILKRGIPLDDHPEFHTYQTFFELGMAPPTHQEMADYIIKQLSQEEER